MAFIRSKGTPLHPMFGNGSDGRVIISSSQTWNAETIDTGVVEKQFKTLIINSNATITAGNRNSGIIIRVQGDCTINGSIVNRNAPRSHSVDLSPYYPEYMILNGRGGNGGNGGRGWPPGGSVSESAGGAGQIGRIYGGGYSGGGNGGLSEYGYSSGWRNKSGGRGGDATGITINTGIFNGGSAANPGSNPGSNGGGGSGAFPYSSNSGTALYTSVNPGAGGNGAGAKGGSGTYYYSSTRNYNSGCGGGAGNIGGGVIIIYCGGILTINGQILCNGNNGADYTSSTNTGASGNGGGAGGGRIFLLARKSIVRNGTFNVNGGSCGAGKSGHLANNGTAGDKYYQLYESYRKGESPVAF